MHSDATTPDAYYAALPPERAPAMNRLRASIAAHIPAGFQESMGYGMPGWGVPHTLFPAGYHCDPKLPVPFMGLASQKQYISVYHMGLYADGELLKWFLEKWSTLSPRKPDMGKGCVRFKKVDAIPFDLIGELAGRVTVDEWISIYRASLETTGRKASRKN